jgi:hypothetical protein
MYRIELIKPQDLIAEPFFLYSLTLIILTVDIGKVKEVAGLVLSIMSPLTASPKPTKYS